MDGDESAFDDCEITTPRTTMAREDDPPAAARITWDEAAIATQESEAGVLYGTQKVQEVATPFLYSGAETPAGASSSAGEGARDAPARTIGEHVPGVGRVEVDVGELRARLGVCLDEMRDPPPPWLRMRSHHEDPGTAYYVNNLTGATRWDFPEEEDAAAAKAGGNDDGARTENDESEEDEPIVPSRLTRARDCAAQYVAQRR